MGRTRGFSSPANGCRFNRNFNLEIAKSMKNGFDKAYSLTEDNRLQPLSVVKDGKDKYIEKLEHEIELLKSRLRAVENNRKLTELWAKGEVEN